MMLYHLGEKRADSTLLAAVEGALHARIRTRDLGGTASTSQFTQAVLEHCKPDTS